MKKLLLIPVVLLLNICHLYSQFSYKYDVQVNESKVEYYTLNTIINSKNIDNDLLSIKMYRRYPSAPNIVMYGKHRITNENVKTLNFSTYFTLEIISSIEIKNPQKFEKNLSNKEKFTHIEYDDSRDIKLLNSGLPTVNLG